MKILFVNKFFYLKGGAERYFFELAKALKKQGHKIIFFSTKNKKNFKSKYSKYFINYIDFSNISLLQKIKKIPKLVYNLEAKKKIRKLIIKEKPDIAHLNNIYYHLSPSIIDELKAQKIPIVMTLHDYKLFCHNYYFFDFKKNKVCKNCLKGQHLKCLCYKNGFFTNLAGKIETYFHKLKKTYRKVDVFIAPSKFIKKVYEKERFDQQKKIIYLPNPALINNLWTSQVHRLKVKGENNYVLYFGRISKEKGLETLIDTALKLKKINFKIVGDGPYKKNLISEIKNLKIKNIELFNHKNSQTLKKLIINSRLVVFPSLWLENCPYSLLETMSYGKPIIASNIGAVKELIKDGFNGLLFKPVSARDLKNKIIKLYKNKKLASWLGKNAKNFVKSNFSDDYYLKKIIFIYKSLISKNDSKI